MKLKLSSFLFFLLLLNSGLRAQSPIYQKYDLLDSGYKVYYSGDYVKAGEILFSALKLAKSSQDRVLEAESYRLLGEVNRASNNKTYSIKYLNEAEAIYSEIGNDYGVASTKNRKAAAYYEIGDTAAMWTYLKSSIKICKDRAYGDLLYNNMTIQGSFFFHMRKDYLGAVATLHEALEIAKELDQEVDFPYIYNNLAGAFRADTEFDSALVYADLALKYALKYNVRSYISSAYSQLSLIYGHGKKDYEKAWEYERLYVMYRDTIFNESRDKEIAEIVESYRTEIQTEQIKSQKSFIQISVALLIALVIVLAITIIISVRLKKQGKQLQESSDSLKEMNQLKDRLLTVLSHDLRSPVATLQSTLELVQMDTMSQEQLTDIFRELGIRIEQTGQLLDNLLVWIKSQVLDLKVEKEDVLVHKKLVQVQHLFEPAIKQKALTFFIDIPESAKVYADKEMFKLVMRNILSNAIKFSNPGGKIMVNYKLVNDEALVEIVDEGKGMSRELLTRIFSMNSVSTTGTNEEVGMGIGLSVVRDFININGGRLEVESEEGKGSKFKVYMPISG